ncbi:hypothetical protein DYBT9275_00326 [Dyadobacter sp. CECT 9275]|uniref:Uncharacterized protein n=1 Tax=Dyadobacter helix TaxID=2822344 RepID=A0A916J856_9BACT|nr:hypothetical protein [Dyadobacter sp. CECT 9275]CAG4989608.1 hypothetical protein DYBT9275_00326 [Dyadobacter sp. CECT 9275]
MTQPATLYQILYQNETLFRIADDTRQDTFLEKTADVIKSSPQVLAPVSSPPVISKPAEEVKEKNPAFPELKHSILILTDEPKQERLIETESLLLENILKAVGHSSAQSDMLNYSFLKSKDARIVLAEKKTNYFITFGVPLIKLNLDLLLPPYNPKYIEGIWFLLADPLAVIEADRDLKKKLWQALQKMFEKH